MAASTRPQPWQSHQIHNLFIQPPPRSMYPTPNLTFPSSSTTNNLLTPFLFASLPAMQKIQRCALPIPRPLRSYPPSPELVTPQAVVSHRSREHPCLRCVSFHPFSTFLPLNIRYSTFSSSAPAPIIPALMQEFGISSEVGTLTISLFVAGYCVGPLLWAPLSEQYGRRPVFILSFFGFLVCHPYDIFWHFNDYVIYSAFK